MSHHMLELLGYEGKKKDISVFCFDSCMSSYSAILFKGSVIFLFHLNHSVFLCSYFLKYVDNIIYVRLLRSMFKY